jgi:hypothetical protein
MSHEPGERWDTLGTFTEPDHHAPAVHVSPLCKCGQPLSKHSIDGQYDGGCWESRCAEFRLAPLCGDRMGADKCSLQDGHEGQHRDGALVWDAAPTSEPCAGCAKVARHLVGEYACARHPRRADPTTLAQPVGRRAVLIYELLSWVNRAPIEQVEALAARSRTEGPRMACVYIAGPYTGDDAWQTERNVRRAEELAYEVEALGACAVCPHTNTRYVDNRTPYSQKIRTTLEMMRRCDAVLFTDDWRRSTGARGENAEAVRLGMPCFESLAGLRTWLSERGKRDGGA